MRVTRTTLRSAFSLLEMVLALALAMMLLLALYVTLNTYISSADIGRATLDEGELARSIMSRLSSDISSHLSATDTRSLTDFNAKVTELANTTASNVGVKGDATSLVLTVYRPEKAPGGITAKDAPVEVTSDIRVIHYWLIRNGSEVVGLARREFKQATAPEIDGAPGDVNDAQKYLITKDKEIKDLTFEFHNGQGWQLDWDGSVSGAEDGTPTGPPAAIKISLVLRPRAKTGGAAVETTLELDQRLTYVHVVALHGGNNFTPNATP